MSEFGELHRVIREVADRLTKVRFVDSSRSGLSERERVETWEEFYKACPDDLAYLVQAVDALVDWIVAAADVMAQIRDKRSSCPAEEREAAIDELAGFLEAKAQGLRSERSDSCRSS